MILYGVAKVFADQTVDFVHVFIAASELSTEVCVLCLKGQKVIEMPGATKGISKEKRSR